MIALASGGIRQIHLFFSSKDVHKPMWERAGLQCFVSVPWVITQTKQNYHPSTEIKNVFSKLNMIKESI